jgi:site-specific DNA-cytosine methylase
MIGKRVLDLNAGLGGRVYALDKSGFEIVGVIDNDVENCEILASWIDSSKIIYRNLLELDPSSLPEADLIIAKYLQQSFSENGKESANNNVNIAIYNIVEKKNPCIFLLEVPVSSITYRREELDVYMQMFSDLGYVISYQVYDEMSFSGYPMIGKQGYIVGERIFDDKRFEF